MEALEITQSKASLHLSTLRHADLVTDRKEGLWSYYTLCPVEDVLAKTHIDLLKANLANLPDTDLLLTKLHKWLEAKNRGEVCAKNSMYFSTKSKTTKSKQKVSGDN